MGLLNKLRLFFSYRAFKTARWNALRDKAIKRHFPDQKYVIDFAFDIAGVDYYRFNDVFSLPFERGLMAIAIYEETRMKCNREYLLLHIDAMDKLLHEKSIDIFKINQLNEQMKERLNMSFDVDLLYKLASVVFFDKRENPCLYDADYNLKKIDFWKKHKGVKDFFLQKPISELIPFLQSSDFDLETYSELNRELNQIHSERLRVLSSKKQ
jgi:hypothetical protein